MRSTEHPQLPHTVNSAEGSFFGAVSLFFLFVCEISREPLNGFAPNSHGRRVWSLARMSLKVKVKGQRSRSPWTKTAFSALSAACVRFVFGKTSLASIVLSAFDIHCRRQQLRVAARVAASIYLHCSIITRQKRLQVGRKRSNSQHAVLFQHS